MLGSPCSSSSFSDLAETGCAPVRRCGWLSGAGPSNFGVAIRRNPQYFGSIRAGLSNAAKMLVQRLDVGPRGFRARRPAGFAGGACGAIWGETRGGGRRGRRGQRWRFREWQVAFPPRAPSEDRSKARRPSSPRPGRLSTYTSCGEDRAAGGRNSRDGGSFRRVEGFDQPRAHRLVDRQLGGDERRQHGSRQLMARAMPCRGSGLPAFMAFERRDHAIDGVGCRASSSVSPSVRARESPEPDELLAILLPLQRVSITYPSSVLQIRLRQPLAEAPDSLFLWETWI